MDDLLDELLDDLLDNLLDDLLDEWLDDLLDDLLIGIVVVSSFYSWTMYAVRHSIQFRLEISASTASPTCNFVPRRQPGQSNMVNKPLCALGWS